MNPGASGARVPESFGRRVAVLRGERGWTQQRLADRVGLSRVAVSNLEAGSSQPSERTVTLLAGLFHLEPHELVAGTDYPVAKGDRLPLVAPRYTEVELQLAVLEADLRWASESSDAVRTRVLAQWEERLAALERRSVDPHERAALRARRATLRPRRPEDTGENLSSL